MLVIAQLFLLGAKGVLSANILFISGFPSPSHHIWNHALAIGLTNKGHNLTLIGPDKDQVNPTNYSHIYLEGIYEAFHENYDMFEMSEWTQTEHIRHFSAYCVMLCEESVKAQGLKQLLSYPADFKFDIIIIHLTIGSCLYPLFQRFGYPPVVGVSPLLLPPFIAYNFGNNLFPAFIPWYGLPYSNDMSFIERFWNMFFMYGEVIYRNWFQYKQENSIAKKAFGEKTESMEELERHISLILINTDPYLNYPQPLAHNFISVAGLHTRKPKEITQEFQEILNGAKEGVIVLSLGSIIRSDELNENIRKGILETFSKLKETVIWKFESDLDNLPKNVIVKKWLPQNDILAHPKVKLFIGHGGALSTQEAIFHGVPMICVPFFYDQHVNTRYIIDRKMGILLDYRKITTEYFLPKIREVLDNPIYTENMKKNSITFRDRLETPLERGIFWIEYVLRHGGAQFLNTPVRNLPFYKSLGLDVAAVSMLMIGIILVFFWKIFKLLISLLKKDKNLITN